MSFFFFFEGRDIIAVKRPGLIIDLVSFTLSSALNFDSMILAVDLIEEDQTATELFLYFQSI